MNRDPEEIVEFMTTTDGKFQDISPQNSPSFPFDRVTPLATLSFVSQ